MDTAEYKLVNFNTRGRAELCRLILVVAGATWQDIRLSREEWSVYKKGWQ